MDYLQLDPRATKMWRTSRLIVLMIMVVAFAVAALVLPYEVTVVLYVVAGVLIALQLINLLIYPPIEYRQWAYLITPDRIEIKKGIFFHSTQVIPISRIQHVMVSEGPLARFYHLAGVTIHTAGGSMKIEGLARETALEICENLKSVVNRKVHFEPAQNGG